MKFTLLLLIISGCATIKPTDHGQCKLSFMETECFAHKSEAQCLEEMKEACGN